MSPAMQFAQELQAKREEKKLSQRDVGARIGADQALVSKWEKGIAWPGDDKLSELESILGIQSGRWLALKQAARIEKMAPGTIGPSNAGDLTHDEKIWLSFLRSEAWDKATRFMIEKRAAAMARTAASTGKPLAEIVEVAPQAAPARLLADPSPKKPKR